MAWRPERFLVEKMRTGFVASFLKMEPRFAHTSNAVLTVAWDGSMEKSAWVNQRRERIQNPRRLIFSLCLSQQDFQRDGFWKLEIGWPVPVKMRWEDFKILLEIRIIKKSLSFFRHRQFSVLQTQGLGSKPSLNNYSCLSKSFFALF